MKSLQSDFQKSRLSVEMHSKKKQEKILLTANIVNEDYRHKKLLI